MKLNCTNQQYMLHCTVEAFLLKITLYKVYNVEFLDICVKPSSDCAQGGRVIFFYFILSL